MIYSQVGSCGERRAGATTGSTGGAHQNNEYNGGIRTTIERSNSPLFQPSTAQQIFYQTLSYRCFSFSEQRLN